MNYVELDPAKVSEEQPDFCLEEQAPHIVFTPYLKELRDELAADETNPIILARRFYDFVTTKVMYSFMREYFTIECIPEYCAINLKGDCGVQALLFITLCRMSGISARWQSGLYVTKYYTGCHDWAQFYVAPYGWVFADLFLAEVHGVKETKSVGTITLVISTFSVCQLTLKFKKNSCRRKNGFASIRLIIREENLSTRIMVFASLRWMYHRNSFLWKILKNKLS